MRTSYFRPSRLVLFALFGAGFVLWFAWSHIQAEARSVKLADWKRIAPDGTITKGAIWKNSEGQEISGEPTNRSGLIIKRYMGNICQYVYSKGEQAVFLLSFGLPNVPYDATFVDASSGETTWSAQYFEGSVSAPGAIQQKVQVVHLEEAQSAPDGAKTIARTSYFPNSQQELVQELRNGLPWNGVFSTPTIPHWRVDTYKNGVATELGKDLGDADLEQVQLRFRQKAAKDYDADARSTIQLQAKAIQSELKATVSFTPDCHID